MLDLVSGCKNLLDQGTLIRVFRLDQEHRQFEKIQELRRGSEYAAIHSIAIDKLSKWLAITSDSGTVHIFKLNPALHVLKEGEEHSSQGQQGSSVKNPKSKFVSS